MDSLRYDGGGGSARASPSVRSVVIGHGAAAAGDSQRPPGRIRDRDGQQVPDRGDQTKRSGSARNAAVRPSVGRTVLGVVGFAVVMYLFVVPVFSNFGETWTTLRSIDPGLGMIAVGVQVVMWYLNGQSIRMLLLPRHRPSRLLCFGSATAAEGFSRFLPAGAAGTAIVNYRLLAEAGVPDDELVYSLSASGVMSALVLNVMLGVSLAFAIPQAGADLPYPAAFALGVALIGVVTALLWALLRRTTITARIVGRAVGWIPSVDRDSVARRVRAFARQVDGLLSNPRMLVGLIVISAARWLVGATVAYVVFAAIGQPPNVFGLFVAFALANVMATIPVSPGGLGIYEATMIAALVAFGSSTSVATAGVLAFRAINFWLPIPLGGLAYLAVGFATRRRGIASAS